MTEATEAPLTEGDQALATSDAGGYADEQGRESIDAAVAAFRQQLEGQVSVSATLVQDSLLDLWGLMPEGESRSAVERWLTETLGRNLYSVTDVGSRLEAVLSSRGSAA